MDFSMAGDGKLTNLCCKFVHVKDGNFYQHCNDNIDRDNFANELH